MLVESNLDASKVTERIEGDKTFISDGEGNEYLLIDRSFLKGPALDLDLRIDLTKPIYEQAMRLAAEDQDARAQNEKSRTNAA